MVAPFQRVSQDDYDSIFKEKIQDLIPEMTDPLSSYWHQPPLSEITLLDGKAVMSQKTFNALPEYSFTVPTGVYEGKIWKCKRGDSSDTGFTWYLRWYGRADEQKGLPTPFLKIEVEPCT